MQLLQSPEFRDLIPPLTGEEYDQLEKNIVEDGVREPLVVWNGIVIDGNNRLKICTEHNIPFETLSMEFDNESDAKIWIIKNQFGRRNLNPAQRTGLYLQLEPLIAAKAKASQVRKPESVLPILAKQNPIDTREEIAKMAGVSHGTIDKVKRVRGKGTPETLDQMMAGQISIDKAYRKTILPNEPTEPPEPREYDRFCPNCKTMKKSTDFYPQKGFCKVCSYKKERATDSLADVQMGAIVEKMSKKEPAQETGDHAEEVGELVSIVQAFRSDINPYLYMQSVFSELSEDDPAAGEIAAALDDLVQINKMIKGE